MHAVQDKLNITEVREAAKSLACDFDGIVRESNRVLGNPEERNRRKVPGQTYFLPDGRVLTIDRRFGDSRYPLGHEGFNFWAYSSGLMHCNNGLHSIFLKPPEGSEPNIAFFGGIKGQGNPFSLLPVPHIEAGAESTEHLNRYQVFCGNASHYVVDCGNLRFGVRVFVARDNSICFSLSASNRGNAPQECFLSSYLNPFMRHEIYESDEARWFKEIEVRSGGELPPFLVQVNEDTDRHHSITHYGVVQRCFFGSGGTLLLESEETTSREQFVGSGRRTLHSPQGLVDESFGAPRHKTTFVSSAIIGDLITLKLKAGACARVDLVFRVEPDVVSTESALRSPINAGLIDREIQRIGQENDERQKGIDWHVSGGGERFKPEVFNVFTQHLKKQVEFCSLIKGYAQLSANSLIGIRDVFQALEALSFWQPEVASNKMLEALGYTAPDGRCFRQYSCPSASGEMGRMDLRPFIDQGAWVVSTVATYLKVSGDWNFLTVDCGYHEIINESLGKVQKSAEHGSVLDHLIRILDFLLRNRDSETKCVLALYGDWNDSLDGLGISKEPDREYGTGVSVMATLQVYQNLHEMIEILRRGNPEKFAGKIDSYAKATEEIVWGLERHAVVASSSEGAGPIEQKILHGWGDRRGYFVGSFGDPDGKSRDSLTSNAFWVLSGLWDRTADPEEREAMKKAILGAFDRLDSKYGLKTFQPAFDPNTEGVGRIGKLPPGTAENGAAYVHASLFGIQALFMMGEPERAWDQIYKVLPFTELHRNLSHSPFVMPNSYGFNPEKFIDGQSMNDWQTGSSNVLMKVLVRNVFGFEPGFEEVWLQPARYFPFDRFGFKIDFRGCEFCVEYENRGFGERRFERDGESVDGLLDPVLGTLKLPIPYKDLGRKILVRVID